MNVASLSRVCAGLGAVTLLWFVLAAWPAAAVQAAAPARKPAVTAKAPTVQKSGLNKKKHKHHKHHKKHHAKKHHASSNSNGGLINQLQRDEAALNRDLNRLRRLLR